MLDEGQRRLESVASALPAAAVFEPSGLAGWTRGHVLAHLSRNADALVNLLTWARTGVETPMYATLEQRDADIEAGAGRPLDEQLADLRDSGRRLSDAAGLMTAQTWAATVRTRQGRAIEATEVLWMRTREVWLHLVDLAAGFDVSEIPSPVAVRLVDELAQYMTPKLDSAYDLQVAGHHTVRLGSADRVEGTIGGSAQALAGWLTGRTGGAGLDSTVPLPAVPDWL